MHYSDREYDNDLKRRMASSDSQLFCSPLFVRLKSGGYVNLAAIRHIQRTKEGKMILSVSDHQNHNVNHPDHVQAIEEALKRLS